MANTTQNTSITTSWNTDATLLHYEMRTPTTGFMVVANRSSVVVGDYLRMYSSTVIQGGAFWEAQVISLQEDTMSGMMIDVDILTTGNYEFFEGQQYFNQIDAPGGNYVLTQGVGWGGVMSDVECVGVYDTLVTSQATTISTTWATV